MHEVIGHGSGRIREHLNGNPQGVLKEQYSALEESRADLVALYFVPDRKLIELGLVEGAAWILRIGAQEFDRHLALIARAFGLRAFLADIADQACQTATQSRTRFIGHGHLPGTH